MTVGADDERARSTGFGHPWWRGVNLGLFLIGVVTLAVVVNVFARRPALRLPFDATKTRAYSLSEHTKQLLGGLEGDWTVALVLDEAQTPRVALRQVNEVLKRYEQASPRISVVRIDPTQPDMLDAYESLLLRLRMIYRDPIRRYEQALDDGLAATATFQVFVQQQQSRLDALLHRLDASDRARLEVEQLLLLLDLRDQQGDQVVRAVAKARREDDAQPIADYEAARSILAEGLLQWSQELADMSRVYLRWQQERDLQAGLREFASAAPREYEHMAQTLLIAADPLRRLPTLELSVIGRELASGELVVIIGPSRAAVIPSSQLFPKTNVRRTAEGGVSFDRRFRGEQVISATIRSLLVEHLPMVVFMHAQEASMLRGRSGQVDLVGVAATLRVSRFAVREWAVGSMERPTAAPRQAIVWVVVPPAQRQGIEPAEGELQLLEAVDRLIAEGEPLLVSVYPSRWPRYGQADPWQRVGEAFGLEVETARVIYEEIATPGGGAERQRSQYLQDLGQDHPVAGAVQGQGLLLGLPLALRPASPAPEGVEHHLIAQVEPGPNRWLEQDWDLDPDRLDEPTLDERFDTPLPIIMAAERPHPVGFGRQRFMLVGSGGWMLTYVADLVVSGGGKRVVLVNPGNHELMLAAVAWLSGMDDLIATSPLSQQVARLDGITGTVRAVWGWSLAAGVPLGCLVLSVVVWMGRRY